MQPLVFDRKKYSDKELIEFHENLLRPRLIEDKMLILLRQGRISKWFSGYGQEAVSVGTSMVLTPDEYALTMHRNLGVFTTRRVPLSRLFSQFQGKMNGFTKGRDRSFHFGSKEHKIVGMISHLGPQMGVADGIALGHLLNKESAVTIVYTGDGGASEGDFHESINVASVWNLPVIFVIENNQWGLSTPSREQFNFDSFVVKGPAYGLEAHSVNGNNILEVFEKTNELAESIRQNPRPVILECKTFRIRGHEEASGTKYYPEGLIEKWTTQDPVINFEDWLLSSGIVKEDYINAKRESLKAEINEALEITFAEPAIDFDEQRELNDLFAPVPDFHVSPGSSAKEMRLIDAISDALDSSMSKFDNLVIMGQDIAEYGGVFKITEGFVEKYGRERVRNTPLCESAIVGTALGLSIKGHKAIMEMQFSDFVTEGFTQIVNNLAKIHWRWGQNADVVIRMPTGAGVAAGPFHSQSTEAWFTHTPGLKVVYPAFPADAKGLLNTAIADPNPVMFFEHKALYRSISENVPEGYYTLPLGQAATVKEGNQLTIVTYGLGVHWALEFLSENPEISIEIIDLRTLQPLDVDSILHSVKKTGRVIVLQEDCLFGGIASDISSIIQENCFEFLDAPVYRIGSMDTPVPFAKELENGFLAKRKLNEIVQKILRY